MARKTVHPRRIWTRTELLARGKSKAAIEYALADGRLFAVHAGVYVAGHPRLSDDERWLAAVRACGRGALLDARSAAEHRGLLTRGGADPQVLVPAGRRIRRPGIVVRRTRELAAADATIHRGIPTVSVRRMLIGLAETADHRVLRRALRQAEYRGLVDLRDLAHGLDDAVRSVGTARLRKTLGVYISARGVTESDAEDDLLALCAQHRIPTPRAQYRLGRHRWDFGWPERKVVLDVDEYDGHRQRIPFAEDRAKDRHARTAGHVPLRVADFELAGARTDVALSILDALGTRPRGRFSSP